MADVPWHPWHRHGKYQEMRLIHGVYLLKPFNIEKLIARVEAVLCCTRPGNTADTEASFTTGAELSVALLLEDVAKSSCRARLY